MLLAELIRRHQGEGGRVHTVADEDYLGFVRLPAAELGSQDPSPGDVVLIDAGMKSADAWATLARIPEGVAAVVVIPGLAAELPIGRIVQCMVAGDFDVVDVTEVEQLYGRQSAVVGARGGNPINADRARRLAWEWACGDLVSRAQSELRRQRDLEQVAQIEGLRDEVAAQQARIQELTTDLEAERRSIRGRRKSATARVSKVVDAVGRHPVAAARDLGSELIASRRRHQSKENL